MKSRNVLGAALIGAALLSGCGGGSGDSTPTCTDMSGQYASITVLDFSACNQLNETTQQIMLIQQSGCNATVSYNGITENATVTNSTLSVNESTYEYSLTMQGDNGFHGTGSGVITIAGNACNYTLVIDGSKL